MKHLLLSAVAALSLAGPTLAQDPAPPPSPGEIIAAAKASEWIAIAPSDLIVMDLAPDAQGKARRVIIQLMPPPFSQGWVGNIRKLAAAHWWDGTSINRVQDNYVAQWGDATEKKALPEGLAVVPEAEYVARFGALEMRGKPLAMDIFLGGADGSDPQYFSKQPVINKDPYAPADLFKDGWPLAIGSGDSRSVERTQVWPLHCYGAVGVGRNMSPDTGTGAELYTVIGHAPRHLDRNIAVVGRVISGIEHLSSLPRGTGVLGFYEDAKERVAIRSVRLASDMPTADQPRFEYLSTDSDSFGLYADARANRRDPFFITPAGGADICNIPVPVRVVGAAAK